MRRFIYVTAMVALLGLSGCGDTTESAGPTSSAPSSTSTTSAQTTPPVVLKSDRIELGGEVLTVGDSPEGTAKAALDRALQSVTANTNTCPEGGYTYRQARYPGLNVVFTDGTLAGWNTESNRFATANGVRIGSTRQQLATIFGNAMTVDEQSSIGPEWSASGLSGTFENDRVAYMYAGRACIAR